MASQHLAAALAYNNPSNKRLRDERGQPVLRPEAASKDAELVTKLLRSHLLQGNSVQELLSSANLCLLVKAEDDKTHLVRFLDAYHTKQCDNALTPEQRRQGQQPKPHERGSRKVFACSAVLERLNTQLVDGPGKEAVKALSELEADDLELYLANCAPGSRTRHSEGRPPVEVQGQFDAPGSRQLPCALDLPVQGVGPIQESSVDAGADESPTDASAKGALGVAQGTYYLNQVADESCLFHFARDDASSISSWMDFSYCTLTKCFACSSFSFSQNLSVSVDVTDIVVSAVLWGESCFGDVVWPVLMPAQLTHLRSLAFVPFGHAGSRT
ncbi:unnamed protein product [Symbiodinium sp. CCMP2592]|nr:unnamed protein product [Symbiodinium sp. CCMP2592]